MKSLRTFLLGFAMFYLCVPLAPANAQVEADGGLYWSVRGGLSQVRQRSWWGWGAIDPVYLGTPPVLDTPGMNAHEEWRNLEMNYGFVAGASIGYTMLFPDSSADIRLELEGIYRRNDDGQVNSEWKSTTNNKDSISLGHMVGPVIGSLEVRSAMFNALLDFHTPTRFTPYLGVGAGMSQLVAKGSFWDSNRAYWVYPNPYPFDETLYALSWQAIVGVGYKLSPGTMLTTEFRYFRLASDRWSNLFQWEELEDIKFDDWSVGVRFTF